jgi:hypothetical protein
MKAAVMLHWIKIKLSLMANIITICTVDHCTTGAHVLKYQHLLSAYRLVHCLPVRLTNPFNNWHFSGAVNKVFDDSRA